MNLLNHSAISLMAIASLNSRAKTLVAACEVMSYNGEEGTAKSKTWEAFVNQIPWILLPDAIQMYVGARQPSHFESLPDGKGSAWMVFPTKEELEVYQKDAFQEGINFYVSPNAPKCVIGEQTNLKEFKIRNYAHPQYPYLKTHLIQDCVLDNILRELVDVKYRFEDKFIVRHNRSIVLNGTELSQQIAKFEEIGFLHLAGKVAKKCGRILNQEWFENVRYALMKVYPEKLLENTLKFMQIPADIDQRISDLDFKLTEKDKSQIIITDNLERVLDEMYAEAYEKTVAELSL